MKTKLDYTAAAERINTAVRNNDSSVTGGIFAAVTVVVLAMIFGVDPKEEK